MWIKQEDLIIGQAYEVEARNFRHAIWTGVDFVGIRYKFGHHFPDVEDHYDKNEGGTVKPRRKLR